MSQEIAFALYRPRDGRVEELLDLVRRHVPTLRREGLATERPVVLLRQPDDGTLIEIFQWADEGAPDRAHTNPAVKVVWDAFEKCAEFVGLADLRNSSRPFPHFEAVDGIVR